MLTSDAVSIYVASLQARQLSPRTIESVRSRLLALSEYLGNPAFTEITSQQIHNYFIYMRVDRGLASGTLAARKSTIRAFFNFARKQKWVTYEGDPFRILVENKQHSYSFDPVRREPAQSEHLNAVLAAIPEYLSHNGYSERAIRDALIVSLAIDSAGRRRAIWSIRYADMKRALDRGRKNRHGQTVYHVNSTEGKTGSELLRFYEDTASLARMYLNIKFSAARWLFENPQTRRRFRVDYLQSSFVRLCKFADVPVFRFQATRKRNVTDVIEEGRDQKLGQSYANHRDIRSTQSAYNTITRERVDDVAGELAARRRGKSPKDDIAASFFGSIDEPD